MAPASKPVVEEGSEENWTLLLQVLWGDSLDHTCGLPSRMFLGHSQVLVFPATREAAGRLCLTPDRS